MNSVYMDYAATTPTDKKVVEAMLPYFNEKFGNASSFHHKGRETKAAIEEARKTIAEFIGALPEEIIFTSGGTEADNMAVFGFASANKAKGNHIILSAVEHHAVVEPVEILKKQGFEISYAPVDEYGVVDVEKLKSLVTDKTILVSVMHANNEIGTIEPVAEIGAFLKEKQIAFHTDAVQTVGHIDVNVNELQVDMLSAAAHKLYGPKGIGILYVRKGTRLSPLIYGGAQEKRKRASTENVPAIIGFAEAVKIAALKMKEEAAFQQKMQKKLIDGIFEKIEDVRLNGHPKKRLPNNVNISFAYIEGESILLNLDMEGVCASTGSACASGTLDPSHVLLAIGLSHETAHGSIRFSLGRFTKEEDVDKVLEVLPGIIAKLRAMSPIAFKK